NRADINDAPAALLDHGAHHRLDKAEGAFQICVDDRFPILDRHAHAQSVARHTGVVDQNIDAAEFLENAGAYLLNGGVVSDVDRISFRGVGMASVNLISGPSCIRLAATDGGDPGSFFRQTHSDGMTDPTPCSCHDCDLIF